MRRLTLVTLALLALAACRRDPPPRPADPVAVAPLRTAPAGKATDALFDDLAAPRLFELQVAADDWAWLQAHATQEQYVPATVTYEGETFTGAAVRFKGSYGSLHSCFDAQGNQTCPKLSMKVSFNEVDEAGRFHGVRKLVFNSCNRDTTCLRERLSYALFREAGVVAPRAVHALVSVNGGPASLFLLVENVDKEFLEDHFDDPDGNLYKEAWPRSADPAAYVGALKTNEDEADTSHIAAFGALLQGTAPGDLATVADPWIDVATMARYLAVDQMTHNWDGIWKFYCNAAGQCANHNFYVYDDPASGRFVVIPWDLDHTFSLPNTDMGRSWWNDGPGACEINHDNPLVGVRAPQCDPLLAGLMVGGWDAYIAALGELTAPGAPLSVARQHELLDRYRAMIITAVEADPLGPAPPAWRKAASQLREIITAQGTEGAAVLMWESPR